VASADDDDLKRFRHSLRIARLDAASLVSYAENMEVRFDPEVQAKLDRVAAENTAEYVEQLVERYIDHDVWVRQKTLIGLSQLDRGDVLTHEDVGERLKKMFQP
jgi:predicted transcriptional regulator